MIQICINEIDPPGELASRGHKEGRLIKFYLQNPYTR